MAAPEIPARAESPRNRSAVPFQDVHISDSFWTPRLAANRTATIEANLHQCEVTGRIKNFAIAGKLADGKHQGFLYNDSDVYKMIEGIAYALSSRRDPELEKRTSSAAGTILAIRSATRYSRSVESANTPPTSMPSRAAASTRGSA